MSIIQTKDVKKWFGDFQALKGITMDVAEGEVLVVCGPSGSGKSTFIRCINRLEQHQEGQIIVDGIELTNDLKNIEAIRSEVGMVFQSFNLFPHLTVMQNITLAQIWVRKKNRAESEEKAMELLERVGIPTRSNNSIAFSSASARFFFLTQICASGSVRCNERVSKVWNDYDCCNS